MLRVCAANAYLLRVRAYAGYRHYLSLLTPAANRHSGEQHAAIPTFIAGQLPANGALRLGNGTRTERSGSRCHSLFIPYGGRDHCRHCILYCASALPFRYFNTF